MGIINALKDQFIDVIEYIDDSNTVVVKKYERPYSGNNEIKTGAKVIVRESQSAIFVKEGHLADIFCAGKHRLSTKNLPILSTLLALPYKFNSPIKADLYFISLKQFIGNTWEIKTPIILRDKEFNLVRIKSSGEYAFKIVNPEKFMKEILGTQRKYTTDEIRDYLESFILESFSVIIGESNISVVDLSSKYRELSYLIQQKSNEKSNEIGIEFSNLNIENITLPEQVEKMIDEQSGIGMASQNMQDFIQYQSAKAIRDAANQPGGIAGLGASAYIGNVITSTIQENLEKKETVKIKCPDCGKLNSENLNFCGECGASLVSTKNNKNSTSIADELIKYKKLLDNGILTQEEFEEIKLKLLNG